MSAQGVPFFRQVYDKFMTYYGSNDFISSETWLLAFTQSTIFCIVGWDKLELVQFSSPFSYLLAIYFTGRNFTSLQFIYVGFDKNDSVPSGISTIVFSPKCFFNFSTLSIFEDATVRAYDSSVEGLVFNKKM